MNSQNRGSITRYATGYSRCFGNTRFDDFRRRDSDVWIRETDSRVRQLRSRRRPVGGCFASGTSVWRWRSRRQGRSLECVANMPEWEWVDRGRRASVVTVVSTPRRPGQGRVAADFSASDGTSPCRGRAGVRVCARANKRCVKALSASACLSVSDWNCDSCYPRKRRRRQRGRRASWERNALISAVSVSATADWLGRFTEWKWRERVHEGVGGCARGTDGVAAVRAIRMRPRRYVTSVERGQRWQWA